MTARRPLSARTKARCRDRMFVFGLAARALQDSLESITADLARMRLRATALRQDTSALMQRADDLKLRATVKGVES